MKKIKTYLYTIVIVTTLIAVIALSFFNNHEVVIYPIISQKLVVPLYQVVLMSFVSGILITLILLLPKILSNKMKLKKEVKKNSKLEKKNTE